MSLIKCYQYKLSNYFEKVYYMKSTLNLPKIRAK